MADFVYTNTYIHHNPKNYHGGKMFNNTNRFKNLKSRYLKNLNKNLNLDLRETKKIVDLMSEEQNIQDMLAEQLNTAFEAEKGRKLSILESYKGLYEALYDAANKTGQSLEDALKKIGRKEALLIKAIGENMNIHTKSITSNFRELIGLSNINNMLNQGKYSPQKLASNFTTLSEAIIPLALLTLQNQSYGNIEKILESTLKGTKGKTVNFKIGNKNIKSFDKSVDLALNLKDFGLNINTNNNQVTSKISFNTLYTGVKYYKNNDIYHLISYSGKNSFIKQTVDQMYHTSRDKKTRYQVYNSLAFTKEQSTGTDLDYNYRVFRSDLIAYHAEKYIAGLSQDTMQRVLIFNLKAYSVLSILSAIIEEAQSIANLEDDIDKIYGNSSHMFTVAIDKGYQKTDNVWIGEENVLSKDLAMERSKKMYDAINRTKTQGKINMSRLPEILNRIKPDGIIKI